MSLVANPRPPASGTVPMRVIIQLSFITLFEEYEGEVNMTVSGAGDTVSTPSVRMKASRVTVADGLINENNYQVCIKGNVHSRLLKSLSWGHECNYTLYYSLWSVPSFCCPYLAYFRCRLKVINNLCPSPTPIGSEIETTPCRH